MRTATLPTAVKPLAQTASKPAQSPPEPKAVRTLRFTLIALTVLLTFEGLVRKLEPGSIGILIFLLKDVLILFMGFQLVTRHKLNPTFIFLSYAYVVLCVLLLPNIIMTASHDPLLAVFGAKEYLLYPIVALSVIAAFQNATMDQVVRFCRVVAFLMIPAGLVAMVQTQLGASSWINMSVEGTSLEDFSSAGHLRVSSTFSFVAQFCAFLNMQMFMVFFAFYGFSKMKSRLWKLIFLAPVPLLVISSYLTGSRGAVIGNSAVLVIAMVLGCLRFEFGKVLRFAWIGGLIAVVALAFQAFFPSLMRTYSVREQGHVFGVSDEIVTRVYQSFFNWMSDASTTPFFGNGLGIMSNGSDAISPYSRTFRLSGWTETDFATTLFEGGPYLIFVWYAFRFYILFETTRRFLFQTSRELFLPGAFCQAYVILVGMTGTLGIQPPIAIWWWLSVGLSIILWWRSVHPIESGPSDPPDPRGNAPSPVAPIARGRSSYADRLHQRH
jgi:O-antigen ligase